MLVCRKDSVAQQQQHKKQHHRDKCPWSNLEVRVCVESCIIICCNTINTNHRMTLACALTCLQFILHRALLQKSIVYKLINELQVRVQTLYIQVSYSLSGRNKSLNARQIRPFIIDKVPISLSHQILNQQIFFSTCSNNSSPSCIRFVCGEHTIPFVPLA